VTAPHSDRDPIDCRSCRKVFRAVAAAYKSDPDVWLTTGEIGARSRLTVPVATLHLEYLAASGWLMGDRRTPASEIPKDRPVLRWIASHHFNSPRTRAVLRVLVVLADADGRGAVSLVRLADLSGLSVGGVRENLHRLKSHRALIDMQSGVSPEADRTYWLALPSVAKCPEGVR
jgi:hypothetical protein